MAHTLPVTGQGAATPTRGREEDDVLSRVHGAIVGAVAAIKPKVDAPVTTQGFRAAVLSRLSPAGKPEVAPDSSIDFTEREYAVAVNRALDRSTELFTKALRDTGMSDQVLALLQSWMAVQLQARELHMEASFTRVVNALHAEQYAVVAKHTQEAVSDDPMRGLSAAELGALLGVTDETVRARERTGELFSVLRAGRKRGREYPIFQAWPNVAGAPLQQVLRALTGLEPSDLYGFFAGVTDLLAGVTPVEALMGKLVAQRSVEDDANALLNSPLQQRLAAVVKAAEALIALRAA